MKGGEKQREGGKGERQREKEGEREGESGEQVGRLHDRMRICS